MGLFDKMRELVEASITDIVNEALESKSVAVFNVRIQRGNDHLDELRIDIANVRGKLNIQRTKLEGLDADITKMESDAKTLLQGGKRDMAQRLLQPMPEKKAAREKTQQAIAQLEQQLDALTRGEAALESKVRELIRARDETQAALEHAETTNQTVDNIEELNELLRDMGQPVGLEQAQEKAAAADERLNQALTEADSFETGDDPQVELELMRLEQELGLSDSNAEQAAASAATFRVTVESGE